MSCSQKAPPRQAAVLEAKPKLIENIYATSIATVSSKEALKKIVYFRVQKKSTQDHTSTLSMLYTLASKILYHTHICEAVCSSISLLFGINFFSQSAS